MALPILPPEPMVQGRSMRTGTAEATAIFAIALFLRSSMIASRLRLCAHLRFLQARNPEAAIHGRTLDKSTFVGRLTAGFGKGSGIGLELPVRPEVSKGELFKASAVRAIRASIPQYERRVAILR